VGCDIHGYWELYHPHFKRWIAFRRINDGRDYTWFGILSGVRRDGPHVASIEDAGPSFRGCRTQDITEEQITSDDKDFSVAWCRYVAQWGQDLHSFTVVPCEEVKLANQYLREKMGRVDFDDDEKQDKHEDDEDYEPIPSPDDIVEYLILDVKRDANWEEHYKHLIMNVPLGEIIGTYDPEEVAQLIRMVVAYDN